MKVICLVVLTLTAIACGADKPPMVPDPDTTTVQPDAGVG